jgi:hypothetical protein
MERRAGSIRERHSLSVQGDVADGSTAPDQAQCRHVRTASESGCVAWAAHWRSGPTADLRAEAGGKRTPTQFDLGAPERRSARAEKPATRLLTSPDDPIASYRCDYRHPTVLRKKNSTHWGRPEIKMQYNRRNMLGLSIGALTALGEAVRASTEDGMPRVVLLGTASGPSPKLSRAAPASMLVVNGALYIVDCGNGCAFRRSRRPARLLPALSSLAQGRDRHRAESAGVLLGVSKTA